MRPRNEGDEFVIPVMPPTSSSSWDALLSAIVEYDTEDEQGRRTLEGDLAAIQEKLVTDAFEAGHDATEWPLYAVIVALRKFAARDAS